MAANVTCPLCQHQAMSPIEKLSLGPAKSVPCRNCGRRLRVSYGSLIGLIPFLAAIVWSVFLHAFVAKVLVWLAGILVMGAIHLFWVPLKAEER
jgi:hypothetical protein